MLNNNDFYLARAFSTFTQAHRDQRPGRGGADNLRIYSRGRQAARHPAVEPHKGTKSLGRYTAQNIVQTGINPANLLKSDATDYVGNLIYENSVLKRILVDGGYYDCEAEKYCFYITDHQGNNRVVADQEGNILQRTDYYPFGQSFAESQNSEIQPYKYNGKELTPGTV